MERSFGGDGFAVCDFGVIAAVIGASADLRGFLKIDAVWCGRRTLPLPPPNALPPSREATAGQASAHWEGVIIFLSWAFSQGGPSLSRANLGLH